MKSCSSISRSLLALTLLAALSSCGGLPKPEALQPGQVNNTMAQEIPGSSNDGSGAFPGFTLGGGNRAGGSATPIQVNAYLWRGALDTLAFMPLVSADPFGGVIITDWYVPPATPGERFKVNAYILSRDMTANAVKVSVFHQTLQGGTWVDAQVDPATASGLEDRILAQAADLQAQAKNTK